MSDDAPPETPDSLWNCNCPHCKVWKAAQRYTMALAYVRSTETDTVEREFQKRCKEELPEVVLGTSFGPPEGWGPDIEEHLATLRSLLLDLKKKMEDQI